MKFTFCKVCLHFQTSFGSAKLVSIMTNLKNKGFTLTEVLVYVAVFAIIIGAVVSYLIWSSDSGNKIRAMREVLDNVRIASDIIVSEIREAKGVYTPTSVFSSHPGQLSLETLKYLAPGETDSSYIDFFLCGTSLCFKKEGQNPYPITSERVEVEKLVFFPVSNSQSSSSVQTELKIKYKTTSAKPEYQFFLESTSTASLRTY